VVWLVSPAWKAVELTLGGCLHLPVRSPRPYLFGSDNHGCSRTNAWQFSTFPRRRLPAFFSKASRCGGSLAVSRVYYSAPARADAALSAPRSRTQLVSRHPSQFPMAHRLSLPRARLPGPCLSRAPPNAHSGPARPASQPAGPGSPAARVPAFPGLLARLPRATGLRPPSPPAGPAPGNAPSTAPSGPPGANPDPGPRLCHRGYEHWPTSRNRGGGALWRRSGIFIPQSPGCHQGTILAPVTAWHLLPCSGAFSALGHFGSTTRPRGRGGESPSRRD
jgi:hypothetical protein